MKPDPSALAVPAMLVLFLFICGCSGTYHASYHDGNLAVDNESVTTGCHPGHTNCSFSCVDLQTDDFNCGECGKMCTGFGLTCRNGTCTCQPGKVSCDGSCTDTREDPFNCGSCGHSCPAGVACTRGACDQR